MEPLRCAVCNILFSPGAAVPLSKQQGAVLNEVCLPPVTFCPRRLMGLLQFCLEEEWERKREWGRRRDREKERQGAAALQNTTVDQGEGGGCRWAVGEREQAGGFMLQPLFYISFVFGLAPLYMCNYHWHRYFFWTRDQASLWWFECVSGALVSTK